MLKKVTIVIQTNEDEYQHLPSPLLECRADTDPDHWQFSAKTLSTGDLVDLLLCLESLGFETNASSSG